MVHNVKTISIIIHIWKTTQTAYVFKFHAFIFLIQQRIIECGFNLIGQIKNGFVILRIQIVKDKLLKIIHCLSPMQFS